MIESLTKEDFALTANVQDLEAGTHTVRLSCTSKKDLADLEYNPKEINIIISEDVQ